DGCGPPRGAVARARARLDTRVLPGSAFFTFSRERLRHRRNVAPERPRRRARQAARDRRRRRRSLRPRRRQRPRRLRKPGRLTRSCNRTWNRGLVRAVNLLPREEPRKKDANSGKTVGMIAAVGGGIVLFALAAGFIVTGREVNTQRANLESAQAELAATPTK